MSPNDMIGADTEVSKMLYVAVEDTICGVSSGVRYGSSITEEKEEMRARGRPLGPFWLHEPGAGRNAGLSMAVTVNGGNLYVTTQVISSNHKERLFLEQDVQTQHFEVAFVGDTRGHDWLLEVVFRAMLLRDGGSLGMWPLVRATHS